MSGFNRYFVISVLSLIIDLSIFVISYSSGLSIFHAAIIARLISSVYNFSFNKYYVFKSSSSSPLPYEIIAFFFLAFANALISAAIINALGLLSVFFASSGKFLIDSFLFVLNYLVQKKIIFKI
ncbi:GtrA family protein [Candidatus Pseudothioglobus singularis]|nr:GtrA family protein [Candidatus Pseudothioglobus singularis]